MSVHVYSQDFNVIMAGPIGRSVYYIIPKVWRAFYVIVPKPVLNARIQIKISLTGGCPGSARIHLENTERNTLLGNWLPCQSPLTFWEYSEA